MTLQGKCYTAEQIAGEDFKPSEYIKGHKITFRPDKQLKKDVTDNLALKRISSEAMA